MTQSHWLPVASARTAHGTSWEPGTRTTAKWDGLVEPQDLYALKVEDFDVIDQGAMITLTLDCARNP